MQIYALDTTHSFPISASLALKGKNYLCPECSKPLRLRGGPKRRLHFYHLDPSTLCRQSQKSLEHIRTQEFITSLLPTGEAFMENRFPEIGRVADVAWTTKKIIFEVQCSFIMPQEIEARNADYHAIGYRVIWILHDMRYNQSRLFPCEVFLKKRPHFYTNMDAEGVGFIYDQYALDRIDIRIFKSSPLPVNVRYPFFSPPLLHEKKQFSSHLWQEFKNRSKLWMLSFQGDLLHSPLSKNEIDALEKGFLQRVKEKKFLFKGVKNNLVKPYLAFFHLLCERIFS